MQAVTGTFSKGSTGNTTIVLDTTGFTPVSIRFWVGQKYNTSDTANHFCEGYANAGGEGCLSQFTDSSGSQSKESSSKCISHYERVGGTITEKLAASLVSLDEDEFTLNFSVADSNYRIHFEAIG